MQGSSLLNSKLLFSFFTVFLSDSSDVNQVKHINSKKIMANDEQYIKQLRDHFKIKVKQIVG